MIKCILFFLSICVPFLSFSQGSPCKTEAKINQVQSQYGLSGEGVLCVMMDRGVDYRHPDFIDDDGNTRIAYIYDLFNNAGANDADNPYGVGTIFDSTEINNALQAGGVPITNDIYGHGTATTGIMAGNGSAISNKATFRGVAHKSKIICIIVTKDYVPPFTGSSGQPGQFNPDLLPIGFRFANDKIQEIGMPSVTLMNIGSISEPTDGSISLCDTINQYVANGNVFVCGVGDDGGQRNSVTDTLVVNQTTEFQVNKGDAGNLRFVAWYSELDRVKLTIERPGGQIVGPYDPPASRTSAKDNNLTQMRIYHRGADVEFSKSSSEIRQILIDMWGENGTYKIKLESTQVQSDGSIQAFLNPARYYNTNKFIGTTTSTSQVNAYSACDSTISPTDYVATSSWSDINNIPRSRTGEGDPGELWLGSSIGPTMDGRLGVDFASPGEVAHAAYGEGSYYSSFSFNQLKGSGGHYGVQTAVSAAAPLTSGVIALLLEVNPDLTPAEIKNILQSSARSDSYTGTVPNTIFGYGKLDALAAVNLAYETVAAVDEVNTPEVKVIPNPFNDEIQLSISEPINQKLNITILSALGEVILTQEYYKGNPIDLSELSSGIYFLGVTGENFNSNAKIVKH